MLQNVFLIFTFARELCLLSRFLPTAPVEARRKLSLPDENAKGNFPCLAAISLTHKRTANAQR